MRHASDGARENHMSDFTVLLIRHADKPSPAAGQGVDAQGNVDSKSLAVAGWQRAGALAQFLDGSHPQLPKPAVIYASGSRDDFPGRPHGKSRRPGQTAMPLAA